MQELDKLCDSQDLWERSDAHKLLKERASIKKKIDIINSYEEQLNNLLDIQAMIENDDEDTIKEVEDAMLTLAKELSEKEVECMFAEEQDISDSFLEIHSGAGGTDSDDWAGMLLRMYLRWAEKCKMKVEIISQMDGEEAGVKSATLRISGENAYGWLKSESGVHRLVRISPFNNAGKRHTSFASVWAYPVIDDTIEIDIADSDLRIDTYRSSGAGGQHVNTTDSAVRITHIDSGVVVQCQNNRSQHRNKEECMKMLKARLYEMKMREKEAKLNQDNAAKTDIDWGHQIRSYVLQPYRMVKDLRSGYESGNVDAVLGGDLQGFMRAHIKYRLRTQ